MSQRILQFGTSRFLQAHADLFVHHARGAGQDIGPITIVKTTAGGARNERVRAFGDPAGFPVRIRGLEKGKVVDEILRVTSVARALDAHMQWAELTHIFADECRVTAAGGACRGASTMTVEGAVATTRRRRWMTEESGMGRETH